jgi:hypothetical protein
LLLVEGESVEQRSLVTWSLLYTLYTVYSLTLSQVLQLAKPNQLKIWRCVTLPSEEHFKRKAKIYLPCKELPSQIRME